MLNAKTTVRQSEIAGVGLFAEQDIKKGEIVWQYTPETCAIFTETQMRELLKSFHKTENAIVHYYLTYCYYVKEINSLIYCLDNGRYVNHSDHPNMEGALDIPNSWQYSFALRDIKKGEELTENYNVYDNCEWLEELCKAHAITHYEFEAAMR